MKKHWEILVTRETVLLERYLRVHGYRRMFGTRSLIILKNLFVVNKDGLTAVYLEREEKKEWSELLSREYSDGTVEKLTKYWQEILENLDVGVSELIAHFSVESFEKFIDAYGYARAIVLYTEGLARVLESPSFLASDVERIGLWHERAEVASCRAWDSLRPHLAHFASEHNTTIDDIVFYLPDEFSDLIRFHTVLNHSVPAERKKHYVLYLQNEEITLLTGIEAQASEEENIVVMEDVFQEIRGSVAYSGKVEGVVRIVNTQEQMSSFRKGEVLVSIMTTPRLMPCLPGAAAIITDEGGIMCHAAIVAREFKIPCIIGTKIATQVLKDGDKVEIDAERGIVRKI